MTRILGKSFIAAIVLLALLVAPNIVVSLTSDGESKCYGSTSNGRLENGVRLRGLSDDSRKIEVRPYCHLCVIFLRTYVHSKVADTVFYAYSDLDVAGFMKTDWVYGETGLPWGGRFRPHRTHRNGLSVDFMVPLKDGARFPTHPFNRFGYDEEFDASGRGMAGEIDFDAIVAHLASLQKHSKSLGGGIARVILAPDLQDDLFAARPDLRGRIRFNTRQAWVRHDDHYHVDFDFPCAPMPSG